MYSRKGSFGVECSLEIIVSDSDQNKVIRNEPHIDVPWSEVSEVNFFLL